MSKVRDLPEVTSLDDADLFYTVDSSAGTNGGAKITKANLKSELNLTNAEIKTAYESNSDTNVFTDGEKAKLNGIEDGATVDGGAGLLVEIDSGLTITYTSGMVILNGVPTLIPSGNLVLNPSVTGGYIYVDVDGVVKQSGSGVLPPSLSTPMALFSTGISTISSLQDQRSKNNKSIVKGEDADISTIQSGTAKSAGASNKFAGANHTHDISVGTPVSIGSTNSAGSGPALANSDHVHAHGDQAGGTLHAAATTSTAGFMAAADKSKLESLVFGYLSYTNVGSQSTIQDNTAYTAIIADSDTGSFANGLLTKTSATQTRADFTGYVEVSYKVLSQNTSSNDKASRYIVLKNGIPVAHTQLRSMSKTNTDRFSSTGGTFVLPCATNDVFTLGFSNAETGTTDTITIIPGGLSFVVKALYKTA